MNYWKIHFWVKILNLDIFILATWQKCPPGSYPQCPGRGRLLILPCRVFQILEKGGGSKPWSLSPTSHPYSQFCLYHPPSSILPIPNFIQIIVGRGGPNTTLKNPQLVWNYQLFLNNNSLCKNFQNPKINYLTTNFCYVLLL